MVVVSGGGWGVGDIAGAVGEFTRVPEVTSIVCLAGRNEQLRREACARASPTSRACTCTASPTACPSCWRRPTCSCTPPAASPAWRRRAAGTPVVSYGLPVGHARLNTRAMADLDLLRLANDTDELREHVRRASPSRATAERPRRRRRAEPAARRERRRRRRRARRAAPRAADPPLAAAPGRRSPPSWRCCSGVGSWMMSTDEVTALAAKVLRRAPARARQHQPAGRRADRARARARECAARRRAGGARIHVSFADDAGVPSRARSPRCTPSATNCCPKCPAPAPAALGPHARRRCARRRARSACTTASTTWSPAAGCPSVSWCSPAPPAPRR